MAFNAELAKRVAADKERRLRCGPQDRRLGALRNLSQPSYLGSGYRRGKVVGLKQQTPDKSEVWGVKRQAKVINLWRLPCCASAAASSSNARLWRRRTCLPSAR